MASKELPKELLDKLTELLCLEIGSKAMDGITYILLDKSEKDRLKVQKYKDIRITADKAGLEPNEAFRFYELSNGYIFDMDMSIAKHITNFLAAIVAKNNGTQPISNLIGNNPEIRRKNDMQLLANKCLKSYSEGITQLDVALFSRNKNNRIMTKGRDKQGNNLLIQYPAYVLRHWDLEDINREYLLRYGIKIVSVEPVEVIESKTGVRFTLNLGAYRV